MNIAMVTITRNDDCRFEKWVEHVTEYLSALYLHIIVDNNSTLEYQEKLKTCFPNSVIIELGYNGGCTSAYNAGIKYALKDSKVDAISLMANDIKIDVDNITRLYEFLYSNDRYGMVYPRVQNPKVGKDYINSFGNGIGKFNMRMTDLHHGEKVSDMPEYVITETGPGGCNMAKPSFYKTVGLQDENLFMYSDEVDMGMRAKKEGILMAITRNVEAWHLHINPPGSNNRHPFSNYLIARNKVYLENKHYGRIRQLGCFTYYFVLGLLSLLKNALTHKDNCIYLRWTIFGAWNGLIGNMKENKYSRL